MNKKSITIWVIGFGVIAILSISLAGVIEAGIIQPVVRLIWIMWGYLSAIDQIILWELVIAGAGVVAILCLRKGKLRFGIRRSPLESQSGNVSKLAFWITRHRNGIYPRWYLARLLADLRAELLAVRGATPGTKLCLIGEGWNPPENIQTYLETALRSTPATFVRQLELAGVRSIPKLEDTIHYIESYMEKNNDH